MYEECIKINYSSINIEADYEMEIADRDKKFH